MADSGTLFVPYYNDNATKTIVRNQKYNDTKDQTSVSALVRVSDCIFDRLDYPKALRTIEVCLIDGKYATKETLLPTVPTIRGGENA